MGTDEGVLTSIGTIEVEEVTEAPLSDSVELVMVRGVGVVIGLPAVVLTSAAVEVMLVSMAELNVELWVGKVVAVVVSVLIVVLLSVVEGLSVDVAMAVGATLVLISEFA